MIWPWLTFFSLLFWLAPLAAETVTGAVELVESRHARTRKQKDYSGVVVWLEAAGTRPATHETVTMIQKGKKFVPHVLPITVGSVVDFPNFDPIFHNAFSNFSGQPFDVGLYAPGTTQKIRFRREGVVRVFCNIHPHMSAVILVLNTPHFAVSGSNGAFEIRDVPRGEYQLRVFHERASAETLDALGRKLLVDESNVALPRIAVSESGYLEVQHPNKHGKPYPPVIDEHVVYPGARR